MKHVTIIISKSPFSSVLASEALRMSVGMIIMNNKLRLILSEEGVYNLNVTNHAIIQGPEVTRHLHTLQEFGCEIIAEQEAVDAGNIKDFSVSVLLKNRQEISQLLTESDYVIGI